MRVAMLNSVNKQCSPAVTCRQQRPTSSAFGAFRPLRVGVARAARPRTLVCRAEAITISKTEIPAFIPRSDLIDQLLRWAYMDVEQGGVRTFGYIMKVTPTYHDDMLWGFRIQFINDGQTVAELGIEFDKEITTKAEWVGRGSDGFPIQEGNTEEVLGKHFIITKLDSNPVTDDLRAAIRELCKQLVASVNKYYAFGSVFADEST